MTAFVRVRRAARRGELRRHAQPEDTTDATTFKAGSREVFEFSPYLSYQSFSPVFGAIFTTFPPQEAARGRYRVAAQSNSHGRLPTSRKAQLTQDPTNIQNFVQTGAIGSKGYEIEAMMNLPHDFGFTATYSHMTAEVLDGTLLHPAGDRVEDLPDDLASLWIYKSFVMSGDLAWRIAGGAAMSGQDRLLPGADAIGHAVRRHGRVQQWGLAIRGERQ